ncbi:MAG: substrate-binding domain-containing protein [Edaphobacter sp.]
MKRSSLFYALVAASCWSACAQLPQSKNVAGLKPYHAERQVSGLIRVYGNDNIPALMKLWEQDFQKLQPGVTFATALPGTEAAMAGITSGTADMAFIGREAYSAEINGFKGRFGYDPLGIEISSGSVGTPDHVFSLQVFTNIANPLKGLTMAQAEAIFGYAGPNGKSIRTWGDLGLTGPMASHPIHIYGYQFDTGMACYFNRVVLHSSGLWNERIKDFDNGHHPNGKVINAGVYVLQAVASDPDGIGYSNQQYADSSVKQIGLARKAGEPFVLATPESVWDRSYPLYRFTTVYINRKPGTPVDPKVKEFLLFILSREGMQDVANDGGYTPINERVAEAQRQKLK